MILMPPVFFEWLAHLLNAVEDGSPWPKDLLHHRASCLIKNVDTPFDPIGLQDL